MKRLRSLLATSARGIDRAAQFAANVAALLTGCGLIYCGAHIVSSFPFIGWLMLAVGILAAGTGFINLFHLKPRP